MNRIDDVIEKAKSLRIRGTTDLRAEDLRQEGVSASLKQASLAFAQALESLSKASAIQEECEALQGLSVSSSPEHGKVLWESLARISAGIDGAKYDSHDRTQILERLVAHVQAAQIIAYRQKRHRSEQNPSDEQFSTKQGGPEPNGTTSIDEASQCLQEIGQMVGVRKGASAEQQLRSILEALDSFLTGVPKGFFDPLMPEESFTSSQRQMLEQMFATLHKEYAVRRKMLIERAKVTLQSMLWSKEYLEAKGTLEEARQAARSGQEKLVEAPELQLSDVFKARIGDIMAVTCKATSGDKGKFEATVKSVLIGEVPDRGGRPAEGRAAAAAASMPAWAPRSSAKGRSGHRGGRYGNAADHGGRDVEGRGGRGGRGRQGRRGKHK